MQILSPLKGQTSLAIAAAMFLVVFPTYGEEAQDCANSIDALRRLEVILGRYDAAHQTTNRLPVDIDTKRVGKESGPEIHLVSKGLSVIGNPFLANGGIVFDDVTTWSKSISDVQADGTELPSKTQSSYSVVRYTITQVGKDWIYHAVNLSNGVPASVGKPASMGRVEWLTDGIKLSGITAIAEYYGPSGEMIPGLSRIQKTMRREAGRLIIRTESQPFAAARDAQGHVIPAIDEGAPLGALFVEEKKSASEVSTTKSSSEADSVAVIRDAQPEEIVKRITTLMSAGDKQILRKRQKSSDGTVATIQFPMPSNFRESSIHVFECESALKIAVSSNGEPIVKRLVTRLSPNESGNGTVLAEIVLDDAGSVVSENKYDVRLWGENGFTSTLQPEGLSKAVVGDWVSVEWTKLDDGRVMGINHFHASNRITVWESVDAEDANRPGY